MSEFNEFEPRLKSVKNRFQLSTGLNLETFNTILFNWNQPYLSRVSNFDFSKSTKKFDNKTTIKSWNRRRAQPSTYMFKSLSIFLVPLRTFWTRRAPLVFILCIRVEEKQSYPVTDHVFKIFWVFFGKHIRLKTDIFWKIYFWKKYMISPFRTIFKSEVFSLFRSI